VHTCIGASIQDPDDDDAGGLATAPTGASSWAGTAAS